MRDELSMVLELNDEHPGEQDALTAERPLGSVPFGAKFRLIDFPLSAAANAGVTQTMLALPSRSESILDHVRTGREWQMDRLGGGLFMTFQNKLSLLRDLRRFVERARTAFTGIMGTSEVANIDLTDVLDKHRESGRSATIVVHKVKVDDLLPTMSVVKVNDLGLAYDFQSGAEVKKSRNRDDVVLVFLRTSIVNSEALHEALDERIVSGFQLSVREVLREIVRAQLANVYIHEGVYLPVHNTISYYKANMALLNRSVYQGLLGERNIYTKVKNESPARFAIHAVTGRSLFGTGGVSDGNVLDSIVFRTVTIGTGAKVANSILLQGTKVGENADLSYVIMDKGAKVEANVVIHGTPDAPIYIAKEVLVGQAEGNR